MSNQILQFDRKQLQETLKVAIEVIPKNPSLPQLAAVNINVLSGKATLTTTDLEKTFRHTIPCKGTKATICIPARLLYQEVAALPAKTEEVMLTLKEKSVSLNKRAEILTLKPEEFPIVDIKKGAQFKIADLSAKLARVLPAISTDLTRFTLTGAFIDLKGGEIAASDGHRLHLENFDSFKADKKIIIPRFTVNMAVKHNCQDTVAINDKSIIFKLSCGELTSRLIEGTFPNYRQAIPEKLPVKAKFDAQEFLQTLKGSIPLSENSVVKLSLNGNMVIEANKSESGKYKWKIPCTVSGKPGKDVLEIGLNAGFLVDAVAAYKDEKGGILMKLNDSKTACIINDKALIMPVGL